MCNIENKLMKIFQLCTGYVSLPGCFTISISLSSFFHFLPSAVFSFVQFSSVAQWCPNLCDPMYFRTPGFTLFSLWPHLFILSGVISPFFPSSILGTYRPEEFIFQCHVFLPFHTVHEVPKARILKWLIVIT